MRKPAPRDTAEFNASFPKAQAPEMQRAQRAFIAYKRFKNVPAARSMSMAQRTGLAVVAMSRDGSFASRGSLLSARLLRASWVSRVTLAAELHLDSQCAPSLFCACGPWLAHPNSSLWNL